MTRCCLFVYDMISVWMGGIQMEKLDYKRKFKELYHPKPVPFRVDVVAQMKFIQIDCHGNSN